LSKRERRRCAPGDIRPGLAKEAAKRREEYSVEKTHGFLSETRENKKQRVACAVQSTAKVPASAAIDRPSGQRYQ